MIVCDGTFEVSPAVSHRELCRAIDAGWQVWGVSSLGAIRAHELRHEGMRGFGDVHAMFERFDDFADDEMCLLHCPEPPYFPSASPSSTCAMHWNSAAARWAWTMPLSRPSIADLRSLWFGDRSLSRIRAALLQAGGMAPLNADLILQWLTSNRLKTLDLARLLATRPWVGAQALLETP